MLPFGVTIPATVPQGSEIPEGLMNNPVRILNCSTTPAVLRDIVYDVEGDEGIKKQLGYNVPAKIIKTL
jgi:hypothetical protein